MPKKNATKTGVFSMKVPDDFNPRLEAGASAMKLPKATLALAAIDAVLAAIERDGGLVLPVEFEVVRVPAPRPAKKTSQTPTTEGTSFAPAKVAKLIANTPNAAEIIADAKRRHAAARPISDSRADNQAEATKPD